MFGSSGYLIIFFLMVWLDVIIFFKGLNELDDLVVRVLLDVKERFKDVVR